MLRAYFGDHDGGAFADQPACDTAANTAAGSCYDCDLAVEQTH
jgi:hypothetical protein